MLSKSYLNVLSFNVFSVVKEAEINEFKIQLIITLFLRVFHSY